MKITPAENFPQMAQNATSAYDTTGIAGISVSSNTPAYGQYLAYNSNSNLYEPTTPSATGLSSITDGTTTITPVTALTVAPHSLSGTTPSATLAYVTPTYGGQETLSTVAASGAAQTLNPATANDFDVTLTANCAFTLGTATAAKGCAISVVLRQDATGSRTVTWPASVTWISGSAPVLKTAASAIDVVVLFTFDGGTTWGGTLVGSGSSLSTQTQAWMPLTTVVAGVPELVWDLDNNLIPTLVSLV